MIEWILIIIAVEIVVATAILSTAIDGVMVALRYRKDDDDRRP